LLITAGKTRRSSAPPRGRVARDHTPSYLTNFANLRGSMAMNSARLRASTSPF
jgi:hypothetical protein